MEQEIKQLQPIEPPAPIPIPQDKIRASNILDDLGFIKVISAAPTDTPKYMFDKIRIYVNGATLRLYVYDTTNKAWRYSTLS